MPTRRLFVSLLGALSASAAFRPLLGASLPGGEARTDPERWDLRWLDSLRGRHRQVFDCGPIEDRPPMRIVANWLDAHRDIYGLEYPKVNAVLGIANSAFPINASHALWEKYQLGERWKLKAPNSQEWATHNFFYDPPAGSPLARMGVRTLQSRGAIFWQCNNALRGIAERLAQATSQVAEPVYAELRAGLNPGVVLVPAHTMVIGLAQERGCAYEKL
ncbi:MAG: hypothetical protein ACM357_04035 [Gemmatimonadota bacterium]